MGKATILVGDKFSTERNGEASSWYKLTKENVIRQVAKEQKNCIDTCVYKALIKYRVLVTYD
jgi:hypothetical protein